MLVLFMLLAMGGDDLKIVEFQRDPIGVYDANGTLRYRKARKELPKPPLDASAAETGDLYSIRRGDEVLYFRSSDVVVSGKRPNCVNPVRAAQKPSETVAAASIGVSSNMGNVSAPCLRAQ